MYKLVVNVSVKTSRNLWRIKKNDIRGSFTYILAVEIFQWRHAQMIGHSNNFHNNPHMRWKHQVIVEQIHITVSLSTSYHTDLTCSLTIILYLLHILWMLIRQLLSGITVLNIAMHGMWLIVQGNINVSTPRGDPCILLSKTFFRAIKVS